MFTLVSASGKRFTVDKDKAKQRSTTIANLMEDGCEEAPCPDIDDETMQSVVSIMENDKWPLFSMDDEAERYAHVCNACLYLDMSILKQSRPFDSLFQFLVRDRITRFIHTFLTSSYTCSMQSNCMNISWCANQRGSAPPWIDFEALSWKHNASVQDHPLLRILHKDVWKGYIFPLCSSSKLLCKLALTHPMLFDCVRAHVVHKLRNTYKKTAMTDSQLMSAFLLSGGFEGLHNYFYATESKQIFCVSQKTLKELDSRRKESPKLYRAFELYEALFQRYGTLKAWIDEREKRQKRAESSKEKRLKQKQKEEELRQSKKSKWEAILKKEPTLNSDIITSVRNRNGFELELNHITPKNNTVKTIVSAIRKRGRDCIEQNDWKLAYSLLAPREFARVVKEVVSKRPKK